MHFSQEAQHGCWNGTADAAMVVVTNKRKAACLNEGGVEGAGDAGGGGNFVLPGAIAQQLACGRVSHHLLAREEAQPHHKCTLHLHT